MNIKCVKGTDEKAKNLISWLSEIYNRDNKTPFPFEFKMRKPETVIIIYFENIGGILFDFTSKIASPDEYFALCQILAVEKTYRKNGIARELVRAAESFCEFNGLRFAGAFVEMGEQMELWKKLGYPYQGSANLSIIMQKTRDL